MSGSFLPSFMAVYPGALRTYVPMPTHSYRLVEYDADRPWIVVANEQRAVDLPDDEDFSRWARQQYPGDRFRVIPDRPLERWPPA
jgi:hypothetical protein